MLTAADRDHLNRKIVTITHAALMRKTLMLTCPACSHIRLLDMVPLWWLFTRKGWDDRLPAAARHFFCEACWRGQFSSQRPRWEITDTGPEGEQFPYPPDREWKRLVSRLRS